MSCNLSTWKCKVCVSSWQIKGIIGWYEAKNVIFHVFLVIKDCFKVFHQFENFLWFFITLRLFLVLIQGCFSSLFGGLYYCMVHGYHFTGYWLIYRAFSSFNGELSVFHGVLTHFTRFCLNLPRVWLILWAFVSFIDFILLRL